MQTAHPAQRTVRHRMFQQTCTLSASSSSSFSSSQHSTQQLLFIIERGLAVPGHGGTESPHVDARMQNDHRDRWHVRLHGWGADLTGRQARRHALTNMQQKKLPTWIQLEDLIGLLACRSVSRPSHWLLGIPPVSYGSRGIEGVLIKQ